MSYSKYTLEQLAHLTGTSIEIITYYERIDLLDKQIPKKINFISSPLETVDHVQFMEIGKKLGIGFNVLDELLSLNEMYDPESIELAMCQQERLLMKQSELTLMQNMLDALISRQLTGVSQIGLHS